MAKVKNPNNKSHAERLQESVCLKCKDLYADYQVEVEETVKDEKTGRIKKANKVKTVKVCDMFNDYKAEDFYLDNIIASGAVDKLVDCNIELGKVESVEALLNNIPTTQE